MTNGDLHVAAIIALDQALLHAKTNADAAGDQIDACRRALDDIVHQVEAVRANRLAALHACERDPEANCSFEAQQLAAAERVLGGVCTTVAQLNQALGFRANQIEEARTAAVQWFARTRSHIEAIDGPVQADVSAVYAASFGAAAIGGAAGVGGGGSAGGTDGTGGAAAGGGILPAGSERVRLSAVHVPADLFEAEPAKGGASQQDMMWAATAFRDQVVPHLARGGTRAGLDDIDQAQGNTGFRRLGGAHDVYLGSDLPTVEMDSDGRVTDIIGGRHRILAAQQSGLAWIPMRVHRRR